MQNFFTQMANNTSIHTNEFNINNTQNDANTEPFSMNMSNTGYDVQYAMYSNSSNKAAYARKIRTTDFTNTNNIILDHKPMQLNVQSACRPVLPAENKEEINKGFQQKDQIFYRWYAMPERMMSNIDHACFADDVYDIHSRSLYYPIPSTTGIRPSMYGIPLPNSLYKMRLNIMGNVITGSGSNNNIIGGFDNPYYPSMNNMGSIYRLTSIGCQPPSLFGSLYSFNR